MLSSSSTTRASSGPRPRRRVAQAVRRSSSAASAWSRPPRRPTAPGPSRRPRPATRICDASSKTTRSNRPEPRREEPGQRVGTDQHARHDRGDQLAVLGEQPADAEAATLPAQFPAQAADHADGLARVERPPLENRVRQGGAAKSPHPIGEVSEARDRPVVHRGSKPARPVASPPFPKRRFGDPAVERRRRIVSRDRADAQQIGGGAHPRVVQRRKLAIECEPPAQRSSCGSSAPRPTAVDTQVAKRPARRASLRTAVAGAGDLSQVGHRHGAPAPEPPADRVRGRARHPGIGRRIGASGQPEFTASRPAAQRNQPAWCRSSATAAGRAGSTPAATTRPGMLATLPASCRVASFCTAASWAASAGTPFGLIATPSRRPGWSCCSTVRRRFRRPKKPDAAACRAPARSARAAGRAPAATADSAGVGESTANACDPSASCGQRACCHRGCGPRRASPARTVGRPASG